MISFQKIAELDSALSAEEALTIELQNNHKLHVPFLNASYPVTFNIKDGILVLGVVSPDVTCIFETSEGTYQFRAPESFDYGQFVYFGDVNKFIQICRTVNNPRDYEQLDPHAVTHFMQQNNMLSIGSFLDAAWLYNFCDEIAHYICSILSFDDVNLLGFIDTNVSGLTDEQHDIVIQLE